MKSTLITLKFITTHPFNSKNKLNALIRFLKWQFSCVLNPYPIIYPYTENGKLLMWKGLKAATGNLYCGLMEYQDMSFLLHFLREGDLFIDIGANIGTYTVLASAEVKANTISIEPIPTTFKNLKDNIHINNIGDKVLALNIGLGKEKGVIKFTKSLDSTNHVAKEDETDTIEVEVNSLDNIIPDIAPTLLKIDVEGFETEILNGSHKSLSNQNLKAIIIELNGQGKRYGFDDDDIHKKLIDFGFTPHDYNPFVRKLQPLNGYGKHNTLYLRDIDFISNRIKTARKIKIINQII